jgi:hypothetical protein
MMMGRKDSRIVVGMAGRTAGGMVGGGRDGEQKCGGTMSGMVGGSDRTAV